MGNGIKDYIYALKNGNGYDWIACYGHELSRSELITIIKEFTYAISGSVEKEEICKAVAEELTNIYEDD